MISESKERRVILVCPGGLEHAGGMGRLMGYLIDSWKADSSAPSFIVIDPRGPGHVLWSPFYLIGALTRILWHAFSDRIQLLHINVSERTSVARKGIIMALAAILRIPVILHLNGAEFIQFFDRLPELAKRPVRMMFRNARCNIVVGRLWEQYLVERLDVDPRRVVVLYNAVARPPEANVGPTSAFHFLFVGHLGERKGVPELLDSLAREELRGLNWMLTLAGGGMLDRFRRQAELLGISHKTKFVGWVARDRVDDLRSAADALVLPSHNEGLPLAVIEAAGAGLAIVTTRAGSTGEVFEDGVSALLVPAGDRAKLAAALLTIMNDEPLRSRLGRNARALFDRELSIESFSKNLLNIYQRYCPNPD